MAVRIRTSIFLYTLLACVLAIDPLFAQPAAGGNESELAGYQLDVNIDPATNALAVDAEITLPSGFAGRQVEFLLTSAVEVTAAEPAVERLPAEDVAGFSGINGSSVDLTEQGNVVRYRLTAPADGAAISISYAGTVNFALGGQKEQYTRGFQSTAGIVGEQGIYLAGSSLWYPYFSNDLVNFGLTSNVPDGWHLISQGNGSSRSSDGKSDWDSGGAVDEIYLVGGPLLRYAEPAGNVMAEVYLRGQDDALAQKYLTATAQYLEMYRNLIGPYPYSKFALVENFWETGYGMPSFTLLGPQIIRFPFILTSSYPHEVLHNWWGNSVFVDYESGNWCEGLTAYMADHLMQELRGTGMNWRRDTLKKYRDFVSDERDFPLTEFRSRHSAATEAVGYGKVAMGFHMLRRQVGDEAFTQALQRFYRNNRGRQATFADIRTEFEATTGDDFGSFFDQWVTWTGAPDLRVADVQVERTDARAGYQISGRIEQTQAGERYAIAVPLYVTTRDGLETFSIELDPADDRFAVETKAKPLLLEVDPEFDVFRLLDPRETAPSIGQIFGEPEILAVLPSRASTDEQEAYKALIDNWRSPAHQITTVFDNELGALPADKAAWFLGADNQTARRLFGQDPAIDVELSVDSMFIAGTAVDQANHSTVIIKRHPGNVAKAIGWIAADPAAAFPGVATKLPHYGKYSYLGFEGEEPANMLKGEWAATDSPLRVVLSDDKDPFDGPITAAAPPPRAALAELPPVFSRDRLKAHVETLASEAMAGRGLGTPGLEMAADYIAAEFASAGLEPGADDDSWSQIFRVDEGEDGQPHDVRNIVGVLPGVDPELKDQMLLVTAHYDHLGSGWPDRRADGEGIYYGADDNASGVAVLIELARNMASAGAPPRTVVFVAFTGEEAGLLGSRHFASDPVPFALEQINAVVNMDTVGSLRDKSISVFGGSSASEWVHIFRGVGFTTGIDSQLVTMEIESSDQQSFIDKGIPGVQISTGATLNYHRPSDTPDTVDYDGLTKVATFVKETVVYLASRPEPLTAAMSTADDAEPVARSQGGSRRVSLGTVPDFAFAGQGVRVGGIVPGSPAATAGLVEGDVITAIDNEPVRNLQTFTDLLKGYEPGQEVTVTYARDGQSQSVAAVLAER